MSFQFPSSVAIKAAIPFAATARGGLRKWCDDFDLEWGPIERWLRDVQGQPKYDVMLAIIEACCECGVSFEGDHFMLAPRKEA